MVFEYSYVWILPALVIALAVAYFKFKKLSKLPDIPFWVVIGVSSLRFLVLFALLFLLLNPAISLLRKFREKPLLVVAQDNSLSLVKNKDSLYYRHEYGESLEKACQQWEQDYEVLRVTFGDRVEKNGTIDFSARRTDISQLFDYVSRHFIARSPDAMVLLTDGIYNSGVNPLYQPLPYPVYTLALGDSIAYPDLAVRSITADKFNFLHTVFPLKAEIAAFQQRGKNIKCLLKENGRLLEEKTLTVDRENFLTEVRFETEARQKGIVRYTVEVQPVDGEYTLENNKAGTWVNIIDNSGEITIYARAPHPDVAALVNAVEASGIYRCSVHDFGKFIDTLKSNLIILHNPEPGNPVYRKIEEQAEKRKLSLWYILTGKDNIMEFARYSSLYSVDFSTGLTEYAMIAVNRDFPYFELNDQEIAAYTHYPPLLVPFGEIQTGGGRMLFTQKIKDTPTSNGMLGFYEVNGSRRGYLWGEGLWRWRLYSYRENGSHEAFNALVNKIAGYLATRQGSERFIHDFKALYEDNEEIIVHAELYNESFEPVNTPDVNLRLTYQEKEFSYVLARNENKYRMNLGNLPAGEYHFRLSANLKGEPFEKKGVFYVRSHNPELNNLVADRMLLKQLAENSGGRMEEGKEPERLLKVLARDINVKPVYKAEVKFIELRELKFVGLILLLLLCTEWFLLKYYAG